MQAKRALGAACIFAMLSAALACAQLRYVETGPVLLHDGAGSASFAVTNIGTTAVPLALRSGGFRDDTSQAPIAPPKVTFAWDTGAPIPGSIGAGATLRIRVEVSGLSGASIASAPIFSGATLLGRLEAVETDAPLNVTVGGTAAGGPLVLRNGEDASITLTNNDAVSYPLQWVFQIGGRTLQSGDMQLAARGRSQIDLTPTPDLYTWRDNLRPSARTGVLLISLDGPLSVPHELLPQRRLQVPLLMRYLSPSATSLWLHLVVALILLLGALLSLIANSLLPVILRKIALRRQVSELADRVGAIGARVDPYLRTLLRMERRRIDLVLRRSWVGFPGTGEALEEVAAALARLRERLRLAERVDELRRRLEQDAMSAPPSAVADIDNRLQLAEQQLRSFALTEDEAGAVSRLLDTTEGSLATLGDASALAQLTAENFKDLKVRQKLVPASYYGDLYAEVPGLFEMLNQPFEDPHNITKVMVFAIDYGIAALQLAFDYAILRASAPGPEPGADLGASIGASPRERLASRQGELVNLLGTLSWTALRELRILLQEMRENIYETDILEEIARVGNAEIVHDPRTMEAYSPAVFSVRFRNSRFNGAAALKRLACTWDFPGQPMERGWEICHFFQGNEKTSEDSRDVTVTLRVESTKSANAAAGANFGVAESNAPNRLVRNTLETRFEVRRTRRLPLSGAMAESVRFFLAFGVALAALFSGALQQLNRLDLLPAMIAVLALGFGADTVKNLLVQSSRKAMI